MMAAAAVHYEPTYRMQPPSDQKFSPSAVKQIIEEVVIKVLADKAWSGEEEALWTVTIADEIKARVRGVHKSYPAM